MARAEIGGDRGDHLMDGRIVSTVNSDGTATLPGAAIRDRSLRIRSTIIRFRRAAWDRRERLGKRAILSGVAPRRAVPFIGRHVRLPRSIAENNSGDKERQAIPPVVDQRAEAGLGTRAQLRIKGKADRPGSDMGAVGEVRLIDSPAAISQDSTARELRVIIGAGDALIGAPTQAPRGRAAASGTPGSDLLPGFEQRRPRAGRAARRRFAEPPARTPRRPRRTGSRRLQARRQGGTQSSSAGRTISVSRASTMRSVRAIEPRRQPAARASSSRTKGMESSTRIGCPPNASATGTSATPGCPASGRPLSGDDGEPTPTCRRSIPGRRSSRIAR